MAYSDLQSPYQYEFVEKPSEDYYCPITKNILREPHLTVCCGNHLSQDSVNRLRRDGAPCPICNQPLNVVPDKFFDRKVMELKVHCANKKLGCKWVGALGSLEGHLSITSVNGDCQYAQVDCPNLCTGYVQRQQLPTHMWNDCPKRSFTCEYCNYQATYEEVAQNHWPVCKKYPLQCPNECGDDAVERQHIQHHLNESCSLQVVECEYHYAGCEAKLQRQLMQAHLDENTKTHLSIVSKLIPELQNQGDDQRKQIQALQKQGYDQQKQIQALVSQVQSLTCSLSHITLDLDIPWPVPFSASLTSLLIPGSRASCQNTGPTMTGKLSFHCSAMHPTPNAFIPPPLLTLMDFEQHRTDNHLWYSSPFYSHVGGYKMCLRVAALGFGLGRGSHVGVLVSLMQGEYDDNLRWPFRGEVTIQLLNQRIDRGHVAKTVSFDEQTPNQYSVRVVGQERARNGWGKSLFIAHTALDYNARTNTEYLTNDCLKFQVARVVVMSQVSD